MSRFEKVLIANRGEIAVRVAKSCKKLGYRTVAVYSEADRHAPHVRFADEAVAIGPAAAKESYLSVDRVLAAARTSGAQAIHPGYGFLSENAAFARACRDAGLVFIGPSPEAIELMGNKRQAKLRMLAASVPCVPGYEGEGQSDDVLAREAARVGYPIMVKAAAGGGGRGMRLAHAAAELDAAVQAARSEAINAFGSGELILERAVIGARHVEIQVFADEHGNVVHLGERDCSVQRRHQKVVEESPSPAVNAELRRRMGDVAVTAARAIAYRGAGTLEFLLAPSGEFFFMEMNTRLQVEHPVTEMITGLDLVEWQLRVARGEPLPLAQSQIAASGHAIEVRLCAEDPSRGFIPQVGTLLAFDFPTREGVRVDHGVEEGQRVTPFYDSMQAKVIAHGASRDEARRRLLGALEASSVLGVVTNHALLVAILRHEAFAGGAYDTGFIAAHFDTDALARLGAPNNRALALAAALVFHGDATHLAEDAGFDPGLVGWSSSSAAPVDVVLAIGVDREVVHRAKVVSRGAGDIDVRVAGETHALRILAMSAREVRYERSGVEETARFARSDETFWITCDGVTFAVVDVTFRPPRSLDQGGDGRIKAPMDGRILRIGVERGAAVKKGQLLAVLEAMKMELELVADVDGHVDELLVEVGTQVTARQLVLSIKPV